MKDAVSLHRWLRALYGSPVPAVKAGSLDTRRLLARAGVPGGAGRPGYASGWQATTDPAKRAELPVPVNPFAIERYA
jgi:hypothetical protein